MEFRNVGGSGLQVSVAGLGCNNFGMRMDATATDQVVHAALDLGVTLFDTADIYGGKGRSEELLGRALGDRAATRSCWRPSSATRWATGPTSGAASRRYVARAVEASLRRLGHRLHRPVPAARARSVDADRRDARRARRPRAAGKVRYIGSSNFTGWQVAEADADRVGARHGPVRDRPERVEPAAARGRARGGAGLRALRRQRAPLLPAGQRHAHRQVPAGRAAGRRHPARRLGWRRGMDDRRQLRPGRGARRRRHRARPHRGRAGPGLAGRPAGRLLGHRRCDDARAGARPTWPASTGTSTPTTSPPSTPRWSTRLAPAHPDSAYQMVQQLTQEVGGCTDPGVASVGCHTSSPTCGMDSRQLPAEPSPGPRHARRGSSTTSSCSVGCRTSTMPQFPDEGAGDASMPSCRVAPHHRGRRPPLAHPRGRLRARSVAGPPRPTSRLRGHPLHLPAAGRRPWIRPGRAARHRPSAGGLTPEDQLGRLASMASMTSGASGATIGRNRATTSPLGRDEELLEVPLDVAGVALRVGLGGQLVVDGVAPVAVDVDLLEQREGHAVGGASRTWRSPRACPAPGRRTGCTGSRPRRSRGRRTPRGSSRAARTAGSARTSRRRSPPAWPCPRSRRATTACRRGD